ncbi:MAG: DUF2332 domain-containing protein [Rhodobacteraceae bacterium]|nr:DUF2332 domain-containing protein [Paracoccaceae bacterium]
MTLAAAFTEQARACEALGSPFMARLLTALAADWPADGLLAQACAGFDGDIGPGGHSLPLRIAGGLHALVLQGDAGLAPVYPPNQSDDAELARAVVAAVRAHGAFLADWIARPPQTNDVRRSAPLIAAAHWIHARHPLPFVTSELGASAGLNLNWDRYALVAQGTRLGPDAAPLTLRPDWSGPIPPASPPVVAARAGVDLTPLNPRSEGDALRLFAYLWPDQPERMDLTRAAMAAADTPVAQGDAIDWLAPQLDSAPEGHLHLVYHTIAWQYFPAAARDRGTALIAAAGARATPHRPLAWLRLENDSGPRGAALSLRLWPGDLHVALGRADFHGRWVDWHPA